MQTKTLILIALCFCISISGIAQDPSQKIMQGLFGKEKIDESKVPDGYVFDWVFKTEIKSAKKESIEMNYLIDASSKDYFGMELSSKEFKGKGTMCMVMDSKEKISILFMNMKGQNMAQLSKLPEINDSKNEAEEKISYKEIGTKTILGFTCYGIQVENGDFISDIYFTLDAPINFSAFSAFSNNKNGPKGFDPALLKVLEEDAILMEMTGTHKKKSKQNFTMTAISLEKKKTELKKEDYKFMSFGMGF